MSSVTSKKLITSSFRRNAGVSEFALTKVFSSTTISSPYTRSVRQRTNPDASRYLSTQGEQAVERFRVAVEDYRKKNYTQEIKPRFRKELLHAIHTTSTRTPPPSNDQKAIAVEQIERLLENIGLFGNQVTHDDVETIVSEMADSRAVDGEIRAEKIVAQLI
jgi:hypothetical protein